MAHPAIAATLPSEAEAEVLRRWARWHLEELRLPSDLGADVETAKRSASPRGATRWRKLSRQSFTLRPWTLPWGVR